MTPERRRRRRRPWLRPLILALLVLLLFVIGIALGEALSDNRHESHTITQDQTFTLQPESATVTVTAP
jgi:hypothetical protein